MPEITSDILEILENRKKVLWQEYDANWRAHHIELSENILPRLGRFLNKDTTPNDGKKRQGNIKSGIIKWALNVYAGGMHTGLTSPVSPFFMFTLDDKELAKSKPVKLWLSKVRDILISTKNIAGFYKTQHSLYYESGVFGPMVMILDKHWEKIINYVPLTCGEYVLSRNKDGAVDTIYRQYQLQVLNVVKEFGIENVSPTVQDQYNRGEIDKWVKINHVIEPNDKRIRGKIDVRNKKFRSIYWEENNHDKKRVLRFSGYDTKPFVAHTLFNVSTEAYGHSPGMDALPDVKELYSKIMERNKALAKVVGPPLNAPSSSKSANNPVSVTPNAINYYDDTGGGGQKIKLEAVYQINPNFGEIDADIAELKQEIAKHWFTDIFLLLTSSPKAKTAFETAKLIEEKIKVLGPVVETAQAMQADILEREYFLHLEAGKIPQPPEELAGQIIKVELISPLAQARKLTEISGIQQVTEYIQSLAQFYPDVLDVFEPDEAAEEVANHLAAPIKIIRDKKERMALRLARQEDAARLQEIEQNRQLAQGAKDLSQADMEGKNALTELLGTKNEE